MLILGIIGGFHDPAACILMDGKIVAVAEEERFSRRKHDYGAFPDAAADFCIRQAGVSWSDIDCVAYPFDIRRILNTNVNIEPWKTDLENDRRRLLSFKEYYEGIELRLKTWCTERELPEPYIVDHHTAHLACAFYGSKFDQAAILAADSRGEMHSTVLAFGEGSNIHEMYRIPLPHSLGMLYTNITQFLGYQPFDGEGTVMGLAPYGDDRFKEIFDKAVWMHTDAFRCNPAYIWNKRVEGFLTTEDPWVGHFGDARPYRPDPRNDMDEHIPAGVQASVSRIMKQLLGILVRRTALPQVCIAGGLGLNSKLNGEIYDLDVVDDLFVFPLANDAGCSIGAAYYAYNEMTNKRPEPLDHLYLGSDFTEAEAERAAMDSGFPVERPNDLKTRVANLLAAGKIVGWVQGRMEAGPRALGNRSILADPSKMEVKESLNRRVKNREPWRPFAATILDTHKDSYLVSCSDARFMIVCHRVRSKAMGKLEAACHIDGTNRVQIIEKRDNPLYYDLVKTFGKKTGIYALMNTSFNLRGQPIVRTPREAAKVFAETQMDALAVGSYLMVKP